MTILDKTFNTIIFLPYSNIITFYLKLLYVQIILYLNYLCNRVESWKEQHFLVFYVFYVTVSKINAE